MQWNDVLDPTRNMVTDGAVYPASGGSVGQGATGGPVMRQITGTGGAQAQTQAMPSGSFVGGMIMFAVLIAVLMFIVHRFGGDEGDFKNIRASAYNVLLIALIAVAGVPVIKVGAYQLAQMGVPGGAALNTWAMAA